MPSILCSAFLFLLNFSGFSQQITPHKFYIGVNSKFYQTSVLDKNTNLSTDKQLFATGLNIHFSTSLLASIARKSKKVKYGEYLACEMGLGYSKNVNTIVWTNYVYDFGFTALANINKNQNFKCNLVLFKFSLDQILYNGSGSSLELEYRYKKMILSSSIESHGNRAVGWLQGFFGDPISRPPIRLRIGIDFNLKSNSWLGFQYAQFPINNAFVYDDKTTYHQQSEFKLNLCKRF